MGTHADILISLLSELNRFDARLGDLVRANRRSVVATNERITDSFERIAGSERGGSKRSGGFSPSQPRKRRR